MRGLSEIRREGANSRSSERAPELDSPVEAYVGVSQSYPYRIPTEYPLKTLQSLVIISCRRNSRSVSYLASVAFEEEKVCGLGIRLQGLGFTVLFQGVK